MWPENNNDEYYPMNLKNKSYTVKSNKNDALYVVIFFTILLIIFIIFIFWGFGSNDNNKNNSKKQENNIEEHMQNIIETEDGYKIEEDFYTKIKDKKLVISSSGSRMYLVSFENSEINEYEFIEVSNIFYNNVEIGDDIKIMRTTHYDNNDLKLYHDDFIEEIDVY